MSAAELLRELNVRYPMTRACFAGLTFRDSVDIAAKAGIEAIIQPGGSLRDEEVIRAANDAGIAMLFTGQRHFRH